MNSFSPLEKTLAWSVHLFTASGLVAGFMAILAINEKEWRVAMLWLVACLVIDGVDGTFARLFKVKEVLPEIDGKIIDYVVQKYGQNQVAQIITYGTMAAKSSIFRRFTELP